MTATNTGSQIAEGWRILPLGQLAHYSAGRTPPRNEPAFWANDEDSIPWVAISDMAGFGVVSTTAERVSNWAREAVFRRPPVPKGTLLMSFKLSIGRTAILGLDAYHNEAIISITPGKEVERDFLRFYLPTIDYAQVQDRAIKGNTLNRAKIDALPIALPPIAEQRAISGVLAKVQRALEVEDKRIAALRELKAATMAKVFREGLHGEPRIPTAYGEMPASWGVSTLRACAIIQTGLTKGHLVPDAEAVELPYLRVANVQDGYLDLSEIKTIRLRASDVDRYQLQLNDVVLTEGGDFDKLGRGFIWAGQIPGCVHQNHIFAVRVDRHKVLPEFLAYQAQSPYGKRYFLTVAHKTTNLACINSTKLGNFPVLLPLIDSQRRIVELLGAIDQRLTVAQQRAHHLGELFRSALDQLMTGQASVKPLLEGEETTHA